MCVYLEKHAYCVTSVYGICSYDMYSTINSSQYCSTTVCSIQYYSAPKLQYFSILELSLKDNETTLNIQQFRYINFGLPNMHGWFGSSPRPNGSNDYFFWQPARTVCDNLWCWVFVKLCPIFFNPINRLQNLLTG